MAKQNWVPTPGQWLISRADTQAGTETVEIYFLLQIPGEYCYGHVVAPEELPNRRAVANLLKKARKKDGGWPSKVTLPKGDPAEHIFRDELSKYDVPLEAVPASYLGSYGSEIKAEFSREFFSPSGIVAAAKAEAPTEEEQAGLQALIPDSYDPCPCASGKKYKFCCKKIFRQIVEAMSAAEEGRGKSAIEWMEQAKAISGETAEILCRYAIVYAYSDRNKANEYIERALKMNPNHPRANYIHGLDLKQHGDYQEAIEAYKKAVDSYPPTDRYHLNETLNNLGSAYYESGQYAKAKEAWERALMFLPSDTMVKRNLYELIYDNSSLPSELRKMSAFIKKILKTD